MNFQTKERFALLYSLEIINEAPLDFAQLAIKFTSIVFFLKKGKRKRTHSSPSWTESTRNTVVRDQGSVISVEAERP